MAGESERSTSLESKVYREVSALWTPQPGPQSNAIAADWCPLIFYGGGKFSGKSDFLLGDYLQDLETYREHWQGIVFRRALTEFTELKLRASEIFPKIGGVWQEQKSQWIFPKYGTKDMVPTLRFRYLKDLREIRLYEGHCVAVGTPIRMGDGSYKPIEQVDKGEYVATLSGPRRVLATHPRQSKLCVRAQVHGPGVSVSEQQHPVDHKILTSAGWVSYASALGIDSTEIERRYQASCMLPSVEVSSRLHVSYPQLDGRNGHKHTLSHAPGSNYARSDSLRPIAWPYRALLRSDPLPSSAPSPQTQRCGWAQWVVDAASRALTDLRVALGFLCGYRPLPHSDGALLPYQLGSDQDAPPLSAYAEAPSPSLYTQDVRGSTQECTQYCSEKYGYFHPYSAQVLQATEESTYAACSMTPCGYVDVCDITVEDVNHYITSSNIINKNSYPWIGVDELGDWEDPTAFFRLFTFNRYGRHPIPNKRIRATGNPGGRGHQWIKKYFVDPAPQGSKLLWDKELECHYMFILGTYRDNKIGMMNDPGYDKRMNRAGSPALVKALKEGDFSVVAGAYFPEFDYRNIIHPFPIPQHWMKYTSMDWGSCGEGDPFSIGWWAVSDGTDMQGSIPYLRRGTKVRYREWYGKGLPRVTAAFVANGIKEREAPGEKITFRAVGGDIKRKADESGPSIKEMMGEHGIYFHTADMNRVAGWLKMRGDIKGNETDDPDYRFPLTRVFSTCTDSIEIIPAVQHSVLDPNDIEESQDDLPDEWRYAHMTRPYATDAPPVPKTQEDQFKMPTIDELWAQRERLLR